MRTRTWVVVMVLLAGFQARAEGPASSGAAVVERESVKAALPFSNVDFALVYSLGTSGSFEQRSGIGCNLDVRLSFLDMLLKGSENRFRIGEVLGVTGLGSNIPEVGKSDTGLFGLGFVLGAQSSFKFTEDVEVGLRALLEGRMTLLQKSGGWVPAGTLMARWRRFSVDATVGVGLVTVNLRYLSVMEVLNLGVRFDSFNYTTGGTRVDGVTNLGLQVGFVL